MDQPYEPQHHEVIVVGAGQVGLAASHHLARRGVDHTVLEGAEQVGDVWRNRYDSLRLYSPAKMDGLPGLPFPAEANTFPTGHQMADYLEAYAVHFDLPVMTDSSVHALRRAAGGQGYVVHTGTRSFVAPNVIVATGAFQRPRVPDFAADLDPAIGQLHSADYRNPAQLAGDAVLVVGVSHSGSDIAHELAPTRRTFLSGKSHGQLPFAIDGDFARLAWPLMKTVMSNVLTLDTPIGRQMAPHVRSGGGPLLRIRRQDLLDAGVEWSEARTVGVTDGRPTLADGTVLDVASIVWCTGFRPDYSWIELPILDEDGWPRQKRGVVDSAPGLYVMGIPFLHGFASMLVLGAGADAKYVVDHIGTATGRLSLSAGMAPAA